MWSEQEALLTLEHEVQIAKKTEIFPHGVYLHFFLSTLLLSITYKSRGLKWSVFIPTSRGATHLDLASRPLMSRERGSVWL